MRQKYRRYTDQEWFSVIKEYKASDLTTDAWCSEHEITTSMLDYHTRKLRRKGFVIPQKTKAKALPDHQEVFCLDLLRDEAQNEGRNNDVQSSEKGASPVNPVDTAVRIDYHGILVEVTNNAAQDIITNTFLALQKLC